MPSYGHSGKPTTTGWGVERIARAWITLMKRLGYRKFVAQGGDWGAVVVDMMGLQAPPELLGIHSNMPGIFPAEPDHSQFNTNRTVPGLWTISFNNPPINMFVPTTIDELGSLMTELEADRSVSVVVFRSANPDFFIAHLDVAKAAERRETLDLWRDFVLRSPPRRS